MLGGTEDRACPFQVYSFSPASAFFPHTLQLLKGPVSPPRRECTEDFSQVMLLASMGQVGRWELQKAGSKGHGKNAHFVSNHWPPAAHGSCSGYLAQRIRKKAMFSNIVEVCCQSPAVWTEWYMMGVKVRCFAILH